jgi:hypothetical protein
VLLEQGEIGIAAFELGGKLELYRFGLGAGETTFPSAEPHERQLVILTGFQLQSAAV